MSVVQCLKPFVPMSVWRAMKAASKLDEGLRYVSLHYRAVEAGDISRLYFNDSVWVYPPDKLLPSAIFRVHFVERSHRRELLEFMELAEGCSRFVDVGASGGVFSALFAKSRSEYRILSIEPDPPSVEMLRIVCERNCASGRRWDVAEVALAATAGKADFISSGYSGELVESGNRTAIESSARDHGMETAALIVKTEPLDECCGRHGLDPDLIKFDIEGFEHEVIGNSLEFLSRTRPRLHLELHNEKIKNRGLDPRHVLENLSSLGYRTAIGSKPLDREYTRLLEPNVVRVGLRC